MSGPLEPGAVRVTVRAHTETRGAGMAGPCYLSASLCSLVETWGQSVCSGPNAPSHQAGTRPSEQDGAEPEQSPAAPQETHCVGRGPPVWEPTLRLSAGALCLHGEARGGGGGRSQYLLLEGSKLHQADVDARFKCHSALPPGNETPRADFSRGSGGLGPVTEEFALPRRGASE